MSLCLFYCLGPGQNECTLYGTETTKPEDGKILAVHDGGVLIASCQCNTTLPFSLLWSLNNEAIDDRLSDVEISDSQAEVRSDITISHISKKQQGSLCCTYNDIVTACLPFEVVRKPVLNVSYLSGVKCQTERNYNGTETVSVMCAVSSPIKDYIFRGFMVLFRNNRATNTFDLYPNVSSAKGSSRRTVWTMAYTFNQEVYNRDILHCRWTQEGGIVLHSNSKLEVTYKECPGTTLPVSITATTTTSTTTATTTIMTFTTAVTTTILTTTAVKLELQNDTISEGNSTTVTVQANPNEGSKSLCNYA